MCTGRHHELVYHLYFLDIVAFAGHDHLQQFCALYALDVSASAGCEYSVIGNNKTTPQML